MDKDASTLHGITGGRQMIPQECGYVRHFMAVINMKTISGPISFSHPDASWLL